MYWRRIFYDFFYLPYLCVTNIYYFKLKIEEKKIERGEGFKTTIQFSYQQI